VEFLVGITTAFIPFDKSKDWAWGWWCLASFIIFLVSLIPIYITYGDLKTMEIFKNVAKQFENEDTKKDEETHHNQTVIMQRYKNSRNNNDSLQQLVSLMEEQIKETIKMRQVIESQSTQVNAIHEVTVRQRKDPQVKNPQVKNPQVKNPQVKNPQVKNPQVNSVKS
jgi:hypothetical protein